MRRFLTILQDGLKGKPLSLRSPHWHTVRKHYLEQHNKCAACGRAEHLQVHHIEPFHLHPDKELDISNFITLCEVPGDDGCHLKLGHLGNWKSFNPDIIKTAALKFKYINL